MFTRRLSPKPLIRLVLLAAVIGGSIVLSGQPASAASSSGLALYPAQRTADGKPWFTYQLAPGQQTSGKLIVANTTAQRQTVMLYPVDAVLTAQDGFGMSAQGAPLTDIGNWLSLTSRQVTLEPRDQTEIGFTMMVPGQVAVGPHYGGIVAQFTNASQTRTADNAQVNVVQRVGVRFYNTVPGQQRLSMLVDRPRLTVRKDQLVTQVTIHNTGNTLLSPAGTLSVKDLLGKTIARSSLGLGQTLRPGQQTTMTAATTVPSSLPQRYAATVSLADGKLKQESRSAAWVHGWVFFLLAVVILGALTGLIVTAFR